MIRRMLNTSSYFVSILKKECKTLWLCIGANGVLNSIRLCLAAWFAGKMVGAIIAQAPKLFFSYAIALVLIEWMTTVGSSALKHYLDSISERQQLELEYQLSIKAISLPYQVVESNEYHEQLSRAQQGISWVSGGLKGLVNCIVLLFEQCLVLVSLLHLLQALPSIGIIILVLGAIMTIVITALSQRRDAKFRKRLIPVNQRLGYHLNIFKDPRIAKEVRMFAAQDLLVEHSRAFLDTEWAIERNRTRFGNKIRGLITVMRFFTQALLYLILAQNVLHHQMTLREFSVLVAAGMSFYGALVSLTTQLVELEKITAFMGSYIDFMNLPNVAENDGKNLPVGKFSELRFEHVSFRYSNEDSDALHNVSFKISAGERLALVGGNGAGKSTLAKLICRLYQPTEGHIYLNGIDVADIPISHYRQMIAAVFQDFQLFPFALRENVSPDEKTDDRQILNALSEMGMRQRVTNLKNGLDTSVGKSFDPDGVHFSGGEKQKIAIARAMVRQSELLLLDEPTAALDPRAEQEIFSQTFEAVRDRTLVFISHRMSFCLKADRILLLDHGCLIGDGTHSALLENEVYAALWQAQAQYYLSCSSRQSRNAPGKEG